MIEDLCQQVDIFDTAESGKEFDTYNMEEFLKSRGAGPSAMATVGTATRLMLGKPFVLYSVRNLNASY